MIKNNLPRLLGERRMKISELARLTGFDYSALSRLYHEKTNFVNLEMADKICWALNIKLGELFEYAEDE